MSEQTSTGPAPAIPEDAVPPEATVPAQGAAPAAEIQDAAPAEAVPAEAAADAAPAADEAPAPDAAPAPDVPADAPSDPFQAPPEPVPAGPKDRRKLFAALRWTAAVLVFATVGSAVAYGITRPERTDVPGLSTRPDGRLVYPELTRPALPAGAPLPKASDNPLGTHYASLGSLLLPAPRTSVPEAGFKADKDGLVSVDAFLEEYLPEDRAKLKEGLEYEGLRQIAGRAWTTPDGTRTHVYLLRFHSDGFADFFQGCTLNTKLNGAVSLGLDEDWRKARNAQGGGSDFVESGDISLYEEASPEGDERSRLACLRAGDIEGVMVQTRKGESPTVPFHQAVVLQNQLLR